MSSAFPNISTFAYEAPFVPTRPRKRRKNRPGNIGKQQPDHLVALERTRMEINTSEWTHECQEQLRNALTVLAVQEPQVLCLGLGSPCSSRDARAQFAWLLEACDSLKLERSNISVYDPVFTDEDEELLAAVQVQRLTENRVAAYALPGPTIVCMPHCDLKLYDNLLRENWTKERLPQLVLIANRFSEYMDSVPSRKLNAEHPCVARLAPLLSSLPLPPCPSHPTAFNNLAIQFARQESLPCADEGGFWILPPPSSESVPIAGSHDCQITTT